ncbi:MAG: hypothetical protein KAV87_28075 [Desulfobacteraceae bacterium]|nr:hypothetical protein [Desulfobacteraceae bacterium]
MWLCDQVDEYYRLEQQRVGLKAIKEEIGRNGSLKISGHALATITKLPFPMEWGEEEIEYISKLFKIPCAGEDAIVFSAVQKVDMSK